MVGRVRLAQDTRVKGEQVKCHGTNPKGANEGLWVEMLDGKFRSGRRWPSALELFCADENERWINGGVGHGHYVQ